MRQTFIFNALILVVALVGIAIHEPTNDTTSVAIPLAAVRMADRQHAEVVAEAARVQAEQAAAEAARIAEEARKRVTPRQRASRSGSRWRSPVPPEPTPVTQGDVHDALAMCESGMRRMAHNGPYHSYFQWLLRTWQNVSGLPGDPHDYDYATQKAAAQKIPLSSWRTQFPGCRKKLKAQGWAIP